MDESRERAVFTSKAADVINLKFITCKEDIDNPDLVFKPVYTHQIFKNEKIFGYENLSINIYFIATTLYTYVNILFSKKLSESDDILSLLTKYLLGGFTTSLSKFIEHIDDPFIPPGRMIYKYQNKGENYTVFLSDFQNTRMKELHYKMQFICLMYIETLSFIDSSDYQWRILSTTRSKNYYFVGYVSIYTFVRALDKKLLRVSQIMIVPNEQHKGHGIRLLNQAYKLAQFDNSIIEINVEDPSPTCQYIRDYIDLLFCIHHNTKKEEKRRKIEIEFDEIYAKTIQKVLKITLNQIRRVYEVSKLSYVNNGYDSIQNYRLELKRRLYFQYKEQLNIFNFDAAQYKFKLNELYLERLNEYNKLLNRLNSHLDEDIKLLN